MFVVVYLLSCDLKYDHKLTEDVKVQTLIVWFVCISFVFIIWILFSMEICTEITQNGKMKEEIKYTIRAKFNIWEWKYYCSPLISIKFQYAFTSTCLHFNMPSFQYAFISICFISVYLPFAVMWLASSIS